MITVSIRHFGSIIKEKSFETAEKATAYAKRQRNSFRKQMPAEYIEINLPNGRPLKLQTFFNLAVFTFTYYQD